MKLGSINFAFNIWSTVLAVVGLLVFVGNPLYGGMLLVSAALLASDWKHRIAATIGVGVLWAAVSGLWLFVLAGIISYALFRSKFRHASAYSWWVFGAAMLLMGHVSVAIFYGVIGALVWKLTRQ